MTVIAIIIAVVNHHGHIHNNIKNVHNTNSGNSASNEVPSPGFQQYRYSTSVPKSFASTKYSLPIRRPLPGHLS